MQLLRGSLVDDVTNGTGRNHLQASFSGAASTLFGKSFGVGPNAPTLPDDSATRRRRLLETYLSERRYILKTTEYVTFAASHKFEASSPINTTNQAGSWLEEVGGAIISTWKDDESARSKGKDFVGEAVEALRFRMESLHKGSGWMSDESQQDEIEVEWARNQVLEIIHIMQILLIQLDLSSTKLLTPDSILPWYRLMNDYCFFDSLQLVRPSSTACFSGC